MIDKSSQVLVVEDNVDHYFITESAIVSGCQVKKENIKHCATLQEALIELRSPKDFAVAVLDLTLPDSKGIGTLEQVVNCRPELPVVVLTSIYSKDLASLALKRGAQDYLEKAGLEAANVEKSLRYATQRKQVDNMLADKLRELENFTALAIGREKRIVQLKLEVNALLAQLGKKEKYALNFLNSEEKDND